ncbi:MAG: hypothetical protein JNK45_15340, partial [Myxococcales bacterium]|nr:hypothetical protein [Myxococcales bacterium]
MTRRRLELVLVVVLGGTACDESAEDAEQDDTGDGGFRVNEPSELEVETSDLGLWLGKPIYAPCPACGRIVARGTYYVD